MLPMSLKSKSNGEYAEIAKLLPGESQADAQFGQTVACVDNDIIAIGDYGHDVMVDGNTELGVGSIFLFK